MPTDPAPAAIADPVLRALGATTEDTPEGIQYVLIRGLHAMGYALPVTEAYELMAAALRKVA